MASTEPRLLVLAAHPDDAEYHAGGLVSIYRQHGRQVRMVSVTDGRAGHHERSAEELVTLRRREAAAAGKVVDSVYETWDFPDGALEPTLDVRRRIIREIRQYQPDLVVTHRTCDYHPDHRAVGQAVQDASYLVTVPGLLADVPSLRRAPVFAYLPDLFTRPVPLRADVVIDIGRHIDTIVAMLAQHASQVYEWLPFEEGRLGEVPEDEGGRRRWLRSWYAESVVPRADRFRAALMETYGARRGQEIEFAEIFEISEYGTQPDAERLRMLFPNGA